MNTGVISTGNNAMEVPALNYYANYTLNTPHNLSVAGLPIMPLTSLGAQTGLHHKQLGSIDYG